MNRASSRLAAGAAATTSLSSSVTTKVVKGQRLRLNRFGNSYKALSSIMGHGGHGHYHMIASASSSNPSSPSPHDAFRQHRNFRDTQRQRSSAFATMLFCAAVANNVACFGESDQNSPSQTTRCDDGGNGNKAAAADDNEILPKSNDMSNDASNTAEKKDTYISTVLRFKHRVNDDDVDQLVTQLLDDPSINIAVIPDAIERRIYKSTIQLTLDTVYNLVAALDGTELLAHEIRLVDNYDEDDDGDDENKKMGNETAGNIEKRKDAVKLLSRGSLSTADASRKGQKEQQFVNDEVLEQVAERLLANDAINSRLVPDYIEKKVYTSCLKVVFRVLRAITSSLRITVCGHDFHFAIEPSTLLDQAERMKSTFDSSFHANRTLSQVDLNRLEEYARQAVIDDGAYDSNTIKELSWWDRWWYNQQFITKLHASLYGLMLGIADDILANTKIEILSDTLRLDIVVPNNSMPTSNIRGGNGKSDRDRNSSDDDGSDDGGSVGTFAAATFAAGLGIGMAVMAIATQSRK